jgi:hypothetical protein
LYIRKQSCENDGYLAVFHNEAAEHGLQREHKPRRLLYTHKLKQRSHDYVRVEPKNEFGKHALQARLRCVAATVHFTFNGTLPPSTGTALLPAQHLQSCEETIKRV